MIARRPVARLDRTGETLSLRPLGEGFPITILKAERGRLILCFGAWFEDELSADGIVKLVQHALSGSVRLREEYLNGKPWRLSVDLNDNSGSWREIGAISYFRFFLFKRTITARIRRYAPSSIGG